MSSSIIRTGVAAELPGPQVQDDLGDLGFVEPPSQVPMPGKRS